MALVTGQDGRRLLAITANGEGAPFQIIGDYHDVFIWGTFGAGPTLVKFQLSPFKTGEWFDMYSVSAKTLNAGVRFGHMSWARFVISAADGSTSVNAVFN